MVDWIDIQKHIIGRDHCKRFLFLRPLWWCTIMVHATTNLLQYCQCQSDQYGSTIGIDFNSIFVYHTEVLRSVKVTRRPLMQWTNCMDMKTRNSQFLNSIKLTNRLQEQQAFNILVYILITTSCEYLIAYLNWTIYQSVQTLHFSWHKMYFSILQLLNNIITLWT